MASEVGPFVDLCQGGEWLSSNALDGNLVVKWIWVCANMGYGMAAPAMAQSNLFLGWQIHAATGYQSIAPSLTEYSTSGAYTRS
jgi:hypothetical protein